MLGVMPLRSGLLLWAGLLSACATSREATEIMLTVDTDLDPTEIDYAVVRVFYQRTEPDPSDSVPEGAERPRLDLETDAPIGIDGAHYLHRFTKVLRVVAAETFPIEIGVVPRDGDHTRIAYFEAFALQCADPEMMTGCSVTSATGARTAFVPDRRVGMFLWLTAACAGVSCGPGMICRYDACRPVDLPPECLTEEEADSSDRPLCTADLAPCPPAQEFPFTETPAPFVVPPGVRFIYVKAWGAGGNDESICGPISDAGPGGFTEAVFRAAPGTELIAIVGKRGRSGTSGEDVIRFGFGAHGGGGLTGLFRGGAPLTEFDRDRALVIAGGGGSASGPDCSPGGPGNHLTLAGGMPTMLGEFDPDPLSPLGGGGGYEGGVRGGTNRGSAGGTGHVAPERRSFRIEASEPGTNQPPRVDDPDYPVEGGVGTAEASGHLVVQFLCTEPVF